MKIKPVRMAWSVVCLASIVLLIALWQPGREVYSGTDIIFVTNNKYVLNVRTPVTIEMASSPANPPTSFVLRNLITGEEISTTSAPRPLGWPEDEYLRVGPVQMRAGTWEVEQGEGEVHITSETSTTVVVDFNDGWLIFFLLLDVFIGVVIWVLGLQIM